jgi:hypothetical protein
VHNRHHSAAKQCVEDKISNYVVTQTARTTTLRRFWSFPCQCASTFSYRFTNLIYANIPCERHSFSNTPQAGGQIRTTSTCKSISNDTVLLNTYLHYFMTTKIWCNFKLIWYLQLTENILRTVVAQTCLETTDVNRVICEIWLMCVWTFSIVTGYTHTTLAWK